MSAQTDHPWLYGLFWYSEKTPSRVVLREDWMVTIII